MSVSAHAARSFDPHQTHPPRAEPTRTLCFWAVCMLSGSLFVGCSPAPATLSADAGPALRDAGTGGTFAGDAGTDDAAASAAGEVADAGRGHADPRGDAGSRDASIPDGGPHEAGPTADAGLLADAGVSADAGAPTRRDACAVDTDCGVGRCLALPDAPGATRTCVNPTEPYRHPCDETRGDPSFNECCAHADCVAEGAGGVGQCVAFQVGYCGGAPPPEANLCRYAECASDGDCGPGRACMPGGAFGFPWATCVDAGCRADTDCTAGTAGECRALRNGSCGAVGGFYCTYASDPCREDRDCAPSAVPARCVPALEGTRCEEQFLPP